MAFGIAIHPAVPLTVQDVLLVALVVVGAYTDIRDRKIYDKTTFPAMAAGLVLAGLAAGWPGLRGAGLGILVAFAVFLIPTEAGAVGGGDAKLMLAVGALEGYQFMVVATLVGFALGSVQAAVLIARRPDGFRGFLRSLATGSMFYTTYEDRPKDQNVPLGVYLAAGALLALALVRTGVLTP